MTKTTNHRERGEFGEGATVAAVAMETVSEDVEMKWRDLALQFDGHRMEAMEIIRAMLRGGYEQYAKDFLARPPLSGEAVLASRLAKQAPDGWVLVPKVPTEGMIEAHFQAHAEAKTIFANVPDVWAAMLAAAPSPVGGSVS